MIRIYKVTKDAPLKHTKPFSKDFDSIHEAELFLINNVLDDNDVYVRLQQNVGMYDIVSYNILDSMNNTKLIYKVVKHGN